MILICIADTGYNVSNIVLTKVKPVKPGSPEADYNSLMGHTRSLVEQTFGQWLNKWRAIGKEERLHYTPEKARDIVVATAVLHNFEILKRYVLNSWSFYQQKIICHFFRKTKVFHNPDNLEILNAEN